jgi:hypothetical protein
MMSISGSGGRSELDTASRVVAQMPTSGMGRSFATEIACPRRVRFYPDSGLNDETRARLVAACWRFAAVSYVTSYPPETP